MSTSLLRHLEEGQQHFCSQDEAVEWLTYGWNKQGINLVYTSDGLAVGFVEIKHRSQINVNVWQIYINGEKPINLKGAQNDQITIRYKPGFQSVNVVAGNFKPSKPKVINGVHYSGRVLDTLQMFRNFSTDDVEDALEKGDKHKQSNGYIMYDYDRKRVVGDPSGKIIGVH